MLLASPRSARVAPFLALFFAAFGLYALAARSVLRRGPSPGSPAPRAAAPSGARVRRAGEGAVPAAIVTAVEASRDIAQLDAWLDRFAVAKTLTEVGIKAGP